MPKDLSKRQLKEGRIIRIGHTPDMDDAFMFYAIDENLITTDGFKFEHTIEDIQALNRRALAGQCDLTAISAAAYPQLYSDYWILSVGSSVGKNYGPLLISKKPFSPNALSGRRIAVPGMHTTAYMLLSLAIPEFVPVELPFDQIPGAVLEGKAAAGLVIHEWQLTYRDAGLLPVLDLGVWWNQETHLPLPLGLNVVRQGLGRKTASSLAKILRDAILYALAHQEDALKYAMRYGRGTNASRSWQFIGMYVNEDTLDFSESCHKALRTLYKRAHQAGLITDIPQISVVGPGS